MSKPKKRNRITKFSNLELSILLREYKSRRATLEANFLFKVTTMHKRLAWEAVTAQINQLSGEFCAVVYVVYCSYVELFHNVVVIMSLPYCVFARMFA